MYIKDQESRRITFSIKQLQMAEYKAKKMGLSFQEYIRYLVSRDVEDIVNKFSNIQVEEIKKIEDALNENKNTKYTVGKNRQRWDKFLSELEIDKVEWINPIEK